MIAEPSPDLAQAGPLREIRTRVRVLTPATIERLYRSEYGAIVARMIRVLGGDFALAEDAVQEAFAAAVTQWPNDGVPENARAWLFRAARNKAVDRLRRRSRFEAPLDDAAVEAIAAGAGEPGVDSENDDLLRLVFTCCHPALALEAQIALTLRTLCGLTTEEIARAFLVEPATMAQRLVRAQRKITVAKIPYVVPGRAELAERLEAVLGVIYLVFSEGYAATTGDALVRRELSAEAIRLGLLVERLMPGRSEPIALVALMLLHDARRLARVDASGDLILLEDQDRSLWDGRQIEEGLARVERALRLGAPTAYAIQAAIAALHARARTAQETDWRQIVLLYDALLGLSPSPIVALNRAAAVAMSEGAEAGLRLLEALSTEPDLQGYALFFAARADLERRLGQFAAAFEHYEKALALTKNESERRYLAKRVATIRERVS